MQYSLLTDTPRSRNTDPATSHRAAARIKESGALGRQQQIVLDLVRRYPGHTSAELADIYDRERTHVGWAVMRPMIARRCPELEPVHVRRGAARRCSLTGSQSTTWWPRP